MQLPLTIKTLEINDSTLPGLEGHDTNYIRNEYPGTRQCAYGLLPDTTNNYKIIWLLPAEIYAPILTTFSKQGQKLSEASLGVGGCGSDCCFECNETIIINKDLSIYSADSIKSCECDDNGPKPETMRKYARVKTTKIGIDGHFTFSDIVEKDY
ncbi:hypothetical protein [Longitalea arenae]|uniref:hypothetical protein n=1 Tax=Longitalea arenae TaxID=2812558 RepID=UPI0019681B2C|nr:hypothetical protein [Longitalea arenae]